MDSQLSLAFTVLTAMLLSLVGTWVARAAALRFAWLDHPSRRKVHTNPIPLLGGIAIYNAFLLAALITNSRTVLAEGTAVLIGATLLLVVGVWDDQRGMGPRPKLAAQLLAALLLVIGGIRVSLLHQPLLDIGLTAIWVVGICNAMNLLDNMDGLSGGVATIACGFFALLAVSQRQIWVATVAAALFGATLGFLSYNWNPATIFMGDAGSLVLGFVLAALGLKLRFTNVDPQRTWMIPLLVLAIPIFDTTLVTISRIRRGISIASGGRDHTSHRLVRLGLNVRESVTAIYMAALCAGAAAMSALVLPQLWQVYALIIGICLVGLLLIVLLERVDLSNTGQLTRKHTRAARLAGLVDHEEPSQQAG